MTTFNVVESDKFGMKAKDKVRALICLDRLHFNPVGGDGHIRYKIRVTPYICRERDFAQGSLTNRIVD